MGGIIGGMARQCGMSMTAKRRMLDMEEDNWDDRTANYYSCLQEFLMHTRYANREEREEMDAFIKHMGLSEKECVEIVDTIHGINGKKKTIWLTGDANTGKSTFFNLILSIFDKQDVGILSNQDIRNMFWLSDCAFKKVILGEELTIGPDNVDTCKMLFEANSYLKANRKGTEAVYMEHELCLISSNLDIMRAVGGHRSALESRMTKITPQRPFSKTDPCPIVRTPNKYKIYIKYFIERYNNK